MAWRADPKIGQDEHLESVDARNDHRAHAAQSIHQIRRCGIDLDITSAVHLMNRDWAKWRSENSEVRIVALRKPTLIIDG